MEPEDIKAGQIYIKGGDTTVFYDVAHITMRMIAGHVLK